MYTLVAGRLMKYTLRPTAKMKVIIAERKLSHAWPKDDEPYSIVGMHVRRTDKLGMFSSIMPDVYSISVNNYSLLG